MKPNPCTGSGVRHCSHTYQLCDYPLQRGQRDLHLQAPKDIGRSSHAEVSTGPSRPSVNTINVPQGRVLSIHLESNYPGHCLLPWGWQSDTTGKMIYDIFRFSKETHFHNVPIFSLHFDSVSRTFYVDREIYICAGPNGCQILTSSGITHDIHLKKHSKEEE